MKQGLSWIQILDIAKRKGSFSVSLRWRDDALRAKCFRLRKEGKLRGGRRIQHGHVTFYPNEEINHD